MPLSFTTIEPGRRRAIQRDAPGRWVWGLVGALLIAGVATLALFRLPVQREHMAGGAVLQGEGTPSRATIAAGGRDRRIPAALSLAPREHRVTLRHGRYADAIYRISTAAVQARIVVDEPWLRTPQVQRLRPPVLGATITNAGVLCDGRAALIVALPPGDDRQRWLLDGRDGTRRLAPAAVWGSLVVTSDAERLACLALGRGVAALGGRLHEVWIARDDQCGQRRYTLPVDAGGERVLDLACSPTGRQLLVVSRQQRPVAGHRGRLHLLDVIDGEPCERTSAPSEIMLGSYRWSPNGDCLAFIARTDQLTSLCLVSTVDGTFHYLADRVHDRVHDRLSPALFPPMAWSPGGQWLVLAAPAQYWSISTSRPFGATSPCALFTASPRRPLGQPLGEATGDAPVWWSAGGIEPRTLAKRDGLLVPGAVEPSGDSRDLAEVPLSPTATFAVDWDVAHVQALVALRGSSGLGVNLVKYWLVRLRPEVE